ncbi:hypothetical protein ON010_g7271 [Phytophthora cinnamomi]|nr:hypothetical protein ON010_g7271 [Phytophthora cinnamomi]
MVSRSRVIVPLVAKSADVVDARVLRKRQQLVLLLRLAVRHGDGHEAGLLAAAPSCRRSVTSCHIELEQNLLRRLAELVQQLRREPHASCPSWWRGFTVVQCVLCRASVAKCGTLDKENGGCIGGAACTVEAGSGGEHEGRKRSALAYLRIRLHAFELAQIMVGPNFSPRSANWQLGCFVVGTCRDYSPRGHTDCWDYDRGLG